MELDVENYRASTSFFSSLFGSYSKEAVLLATIPKITAALSVIGSTLILVYVLKRKREGRVIQVYHRIMFSMACGDLVSSLNYFAGTFPIPQGTTGDFGPVFWALGSPMSCRICGAWAQLQVLSPVYNGVLALYYLLVVKFQWNEQRVKAVEPLLHAVPLVFAISTAILGAVWDIYGSVEWLCWVDSTHSEYYVALRWIFLFAPVWICWTLVTLVMVSLYLAMRDLERANQRYILPDNRDHHHHHTKHEKSRQIAVQGMLYVLAFYTSWFFPSIQRILNLLNKPSNFALQMLDTSLLPLQGLLNALIYVRPRYLRLHRQHPDLSRWQLLRATYQNNQATSSTGPSPRYLRPPTTSANSTTRTTIRTTQSQSTSTDPADEVETALPTPLQRRTSSAVVTSLPTINNNTIT